MISRSLIDCRPPRACNQMSTSRYNAAAPASFNVVVRWLVVRAPSRAEQRWRKAPGKVRFSRALRVGPAVSPAEDRGEARIAFSRSDAAASPVMLGRIYGLLDEGNIEGFAGRRPLAARP